MAAVSLCASVRPPPLRLSRPPSLTTGCPQVSEQSNPLIQLDDNPAGPMGRIAWRELPCGGSSLAVVVKLLCVGRPISLGLSAGARLGRRRLPFDRLPLAWLVAGSEVRV